MFEMMLWIGAIVVFGGHFLISRLRPDWLGAVVPVLWLGAVVALGVGGQLTGIRDFAFAAIGELVLLVLWGRGLEAKKQKRRIETARIDNQRPLG